jgi:hypothetical protein
MPSQEFTTLSTQSFCNALHPIPRKRKKALRMEEKKRRKTLIERSAIRSAAGKETWKKRKANAK